MLLEASPDRGHFGVREILPRSHSFRDILIFGRLPGSVACSSFVVLTAPTRKMQPAVPPSPLSDSTEVGFSPLQTSGHQAISLQSCYQDDH